MERLLVVVLVAVACTVASVAAHAQTSDTAKDELATSEGANAGRVERLSQALRGAESFKARAMAAVALGRLGDLQAASALADALRIDEHYAVRVAAASALGRLPSAVGVPALLLALHDTDAFVRDEANAALDRFHTPATVTAFQAALSSDDSVTRLAAVRAYGDVLREHADAAPAVLAALGDGDARVRLAAESALAGVPHERAVPMLIQALNEGGTEVRGASARLLEKRADKSAVEPLIALVVSSEDAEDVHAAARAALRAHREYVDIPARVSATRDNTPAGREARLAALRVLAALQDPAAAPAIEQALLDTDPATRVAAARAAWDLGGDQGRKLLAKARANETDARTQKQIELLLKTRHSD